MNTLNRLFHEQILGHGPAFVEFAKEKSYRHGVIIECDCGKRWLSRAPWDRISL